MNITMPSRQFLVQQALLNAVGNIFPLFVAQGKAGEVLSYVSLGGTLLSKDTQTYREFIKEFRKIEAQYMMAGAGKPVQR